MAAQMTAKTLNALKGWPSPSAIDFTAEFAASITDVVPQAAVVHLNSAGEYELGVGDLNVMPLFTFNASDDPDVINRDAGDPATEVDVFIPISPTGQALAFPAVIAAELTGTHFVDGAYPVNTPLTSPTTGDNAGKLTSGTIGTNMIVGIVSRGIVDNGYGSPAIAFWPFPIFPG